MFTHVVSPYLGVAECVLRWTSMSMLCVRNIKKKCDLQKIHHAFIKYIGGSTLQNMVILWPFLMSWHFGALKSVIRVRKSDALFMPLESLKVLPGFWAPLCAQQQKSLTHMVSPYSGGVQECVLGCICKYAHAACDLTFLIFQKILAKKYNFKDHPMFLTNNCGRSSFEK